MVELSYFPALLRNIRWGNMESHEKEKHLREPLLCDSSTEDSSESDDDGVRERHMAYKSHVVVTVEPKLTRSERLLRSGWSLSTFSRQHHMNIVPSVETTQDIVNKALAQLAALTIAAVGLLLFALYRQVV
ncbi:hypothetical protein DYB36_002875 [Aphanomyces astaci]|uniref:Uncharacterized protein n=1 Tax=Aphanomyces astaci TaxID=112090 RepID=A0A397BQY5_APHAT|nr:hypothetical protein DYB36_002875 [Aphanomyces astaci]